MAWLFLLVAGALEVFWSTCLKFSQGLTVPKFTVCTIVGMVLSFVFLSQATKVLPWAPPTPSGQASAPWARWWWAW